MTQEENSSTPNNALKETIIKEVEYSIPHSEKAASIMYLGQFSRNEPTLNAVSKSSLTSDILEAVNDNGRLVFVTGDHAEHSLMLWFIEELRKLPLNHTISALAFDTSTTRSAKKAEQQLVEKIASGDLVIFLPGCLARSELVAACQLCTERGVKTWGILRSNSMLAKTVTHSILIQNNLHQWNELTRELFVVFDFVLSQVSNSTTISGYPTGIFRGKNGTIPIFKRAGLSDKINQ